MSPFLSLGMFLFVFLFFAMAIKVPVALSIALGTFCVLLSNDYSLMIFSQSMYSTLDSFPMLAMPYFILAGAIMQYSGISTALLNMVDSFVGRVRGNLGAIAVLGSMAFGVLTGATMATLSAIGGMMIEPMCKNGYTRSYTAALIAAASFLGVLIPPSVPGIMFATVSSTKVSEVWLATIGPGVMLGIFYIVINYMIVGRREVKAESSFALGSYLKTATCQTGRAFWALLMPVIIFGGIYGGIVTPTEAGAVSVIYGLAYFFAKKCIFKKGDIKESMWKIFVSSAGTTAVIGLIMCASTGAGRAIALSGIADALASFITGSIASADMFLMIVVLILLFLGTFMSHTPSILIMTPLLMPTVEAFAIDPVHFGSVMLVTLSLGQITPPYAGSIFLACKLSGAPFGAVCKDLIPFFACGLVTVLFTVFFPQLSLFLIN